MYTTRRQMLQPDLHLQDHGVREMQESDKRRNDHASERWDLQDARVAVTCIICSALMWLVPFSLSADC